MNNRIFLGFIIAMSLAIVGCGDSPSSAPVGSGGSGAGTNSPNIPREAGEEQTAQTTVRIGSFNNSGQFVEDAIKANQTLLEAGESANLEVALITQSGARYMEPTDISFTSACISSGLSEVAPAIATSNGGSAQATYTARGCNGNDQVTAITSVEGTTLRANVDIQTEPAPLGALGFVSVSNTAIGIQGTDVLEQQSVITFKLTNISGGPAPNQVVSFKLNTSVGGVLLSNEQNTTDANGLVSTTITSGTVAIPVRVTATAQMDGVTTTAQSSMVSITTGIPHQEGFSLSAETLNIEGGDWDGVTTEVTIRATDRYNNPVSDGTVVNFTAEGGSIGGHCLTAGGACSVTFTTQNPRPMSGRISILAHAIGEESFIDLNGNGRYDDGEPFGDLPEAFRDEFETGSWEPGDLFIDFNDNQAYDGPNSRFDGLLCNGPNNCGNETLSVFQNLVMVMSDSSFIIDIEPGVIDLSSGPVDVVISIADSNDNKPSSGTRYSLTTTHGEIILDLISNTQPSNNELGPQVFVVTIGPEDNAGNGVLTFTATTSQAPSPTTSRGTASVVEP